MNISTSKKKETNLFYEAILNHLHQYSDFFMKALISTKHGGQWEVEHENLTKKLQLWVIHHPSNITKAGGISLNYLLIVT